jgi:hypothetical protein
MDAQNHWDWIYGTKAPDAVSWYRPHLGTSLQLITQAAPTHSASIIDVGGGESTLVDDLLVRGYADDVFDFLAVYILPEDFWYIIPKNIFGAHASVALRRQCRTRNTPNTSAPGN